MKKILHLLIIVLLLASCSKEEESPESTTSYTAKVDGDFWRAKSTEASITNGTIVVIGKSSDGTILTFSLSGDSLGVYGLNENTNSSGTFLLDGGSTPFTSGANSSAGGQVLIEDINRTSKRITGSIELTAVRASDDSTIVISSGRFVNIPYGNVPIGTGDNSLKSKVNGNNWSPQNVSGFVAFKTIYLQATDADGIRKLTFEIPELIGPGKYELNYFTNYKAVYTSINQKNHYATNGTLEIVFHNLVKREIEAKFEMVTEAHESGGKVTFTEGEFLIIYE